MGILYRKHLSLSPLPLRCYQQSIDYQIVLQGGNGDKVLKIIVRACAHAREKDRVSR